MLAHRRLAIIDLSPGGVQPMHSADRRYVITFNGEIYNYRDIRDELAAAGRAMRSDSDTEVLLEACALWGVESGGRARHRHVRLCALGSHYAHALAGARSTRYQAALLCGNARSACCSPRNSRRFVPRLIGSRRSTTMPSWAFCVTVISRQPHTIYREAAKLPPGHILTLAARASAGVELLLGRACASRLPGQPRNDPAPGRGLRRWSNSMRCSATP